MCSLQVLNTRKDLIGTITEKISEDVTLRSPSCSMLRARSFSTAIKCNVWSSEELLLLLSSCSSSSINSASEIGNQGSTEIGKIKIQRISVIRQSMATSDTICSQVNSSKTLREKFVNKETKMWNNKRTLCCKCGVFVVRA